jgi:hypothetical protein
MKALLQHATDQGESAFVLDGPIGICRHREQQLSFLLSLVPKQRRQVPFWKETALTTPKSLSQYFPKWKMSTDISKTGGEWEGVKGVEPRN